MLEEERRIKKSLLCITRNSFSLWMKGRRGKKYSWPLPPSYRAFHCHRAELLGSGRKERNCHWRDSKSELVSTLGVKGSWWAPGTVPGGVLIQHSEHAGADSLQIDHSCYPRFRSLPFSKPAAALENRSTPLERRRSFSRCQSHVSHLDPDNNSKTTGCLANTSR